jgi:hypothetical protein
MTTPEFACQTIIAYLLFMSNILFLAKPLADSTEMVAKNEGSTH